MTAFEREKAEDNKFEEFQVLENAYRLHTQLYQEVCLLFQFSNARFSFSMIILTCSNSIDGRYTTKELPDTPS